MQRKHERRQRPLGACQKCTLRPCPIYGVGICTSTPQVMRIRNTRKAATEYFSLKQQGEMTLNVSSAPVFIFSVIAYTVQSIPIGNLEMILFFLFQGGSGTQLLKGISDCTACTS